MLPQGFHTTAASTVGQCQYQEGNAVVLGRYQEGYAASSTASVPGNRMVTSTTSYSLSTRRRMLVQQLQYMGAMWLLVHHQYQKGYAATRTASVPGELCGYE